MPDTRRNGFSLIEILVALAIAIVVAAVVAPGIASSLDRARRDRALDSLESVRDGVLAFNDDVREYPGTLTQLAAPIGGADVDICGNGYNGGEQNRWDGPYLDRVLPAAGLPIAAGTVSTTFVLITQAGDIDWFSIETTGVEQGDALELDDEVDDGDGSAAGAIQWGTPDAEGLVTLSYIFPIATC
jgi:prepilin-type N-terminal cleavage/methylation domain-containing protein